MRRTWLNKLTLHISPRILLAVNSTFKYIRFRTVYKLSDNFRIDVIQDNFSIQKEYYSARAHEFEQIYERDDPVRTHEIETISSLIEREFSGKHVLEIACGTGFWTQFTTGSAKYIVATDFSDSMLEIARSKMLAVDKVSFCNCEAFNLQQIEGEFNAGMANFFLSHVPKLRLKEFLTGFHNRLEEGATTSGECFWWLICRTRE